MSTRFLKDAFGWGFSLWVIGYALGIEYSLVSRGPETTIFPMLGELGIGVTAYSSPSGLG